MIKIFKNMSKDNKDSSSKEPFCDRVNCILFLMFLFVLFSITFNGCFSCSGSTGEAKEAVEDRTESKNNIMSDSLINNENHVSEQ